jgi:sigma-B regulation protein RsbU (phosphoserine phosphatase)
MFFRRKKKETADAPAPAATTPDVAAEGPTLGEAPTLAPEPASKSTPTTQFLTGEAGRDRRTVQLLLETIARVSRSRDLESLLEYVVDSSVQITGAERGLLLLRDGEALSVRTARARGEKPLAGDLRFSTSVANKVLREVQPVRATVHSESEMLELGKSVYDLKLRAVMCVPLASPGDERESAQPKGVLYVDSRAATRQFTQGDLALFAALAQQISIAMENARLHLDSLQKVKLEQSIELASAIQRDLMSGVPTDVPGWDLHGWYRPAEEAGADFYEFLKSKDGRMAVIVGDATGHGIGPALITATSQGMLRAYLRMLSDPGEVLTHLNQDLCERVEDGRFLTLYLGMLASDGTVASLNAGHAEPLIWRRATGEIEVILGSAPALGFIPGEEYRSLPPYRLDAGDVLLIYTDGLSEARDPRTPEVLFGLDGLRAALGRAAGAGKDARAISLEVVEAAMAASGGVHEDDITIVVARRKEPAP